ncbi:hypothetical protein CONLIGDRAFT_638962 [Coniochaeta ligniaria NRRL 30616]|uniref:Uncharacterized protein n=1 Tax=Coniochaeta ligniaria NRRL 30616 TaxID=1408157 RepID=A0A1J7J590_9PEZI|nr:hypothetical protein CONLIGDRAFT_638962 [Coniochaeta ligniaria NRRL 30616]
MANKVIATKVPEPELKKGNVIKLPKIKTPIPKKDGPLRKRLYGNARRSPPVLRRREAKRPHDAQDDSDSEHEPSAKKATISTISDISKKELQRLNDSAIGAQGRPFVQKRKGAVQDAMEFFRFTGFAHRLFGGTKTQVLPELIDELSHA